MPLVRPPDLWLPMDNLPGRNLRTPVASQVRRWAASLNHVAGEHRRLLFCQHFADDTESSLAPIVRFRYNEDRQNARRLSWTGLYLPPFTAAPAPGTAVPRIESSAGNQWASAEIVPTISEPADVRALAFGEDITPTGAYNTRTASTVNAFRLVALACYENLPFVTMDTAWGESVAGAAITTNPITTTFLSDLRALEEALWLRHRPVVAAWSARGFAAAQARSVTGTTTLTNLIDLASTARTATTPGEVCPSRYAGRVTATTVAARCAVYAEVTAGLGNVSFRAAGSTLSFTVAGGPAWTEGGSVNLDTTVEYDKVDIMAAPDNAANTVRVWAWMIQVDPT